MNRGLKAIGIVLSLLLMSVLLMVILVTLPSVGLPANFSINRTQLLFNSFTNSLFQQYLFWVALVFFIALLILIFVFIFYPRIKQTFVLKEDQGQLSLDKKAIEGFVRSKLVGVGFVGNPKVNVRATNRKINVNVKGQLTRTSSHIGKTELLMEEIRRDLQDILGPEEKVKVNIAYTEYEKEDKRATSKQRVV